MFNPLVSVIVPIFQAENTLANTLGSIQDQTYENFEVICVNDGSTDRSREICETFLTDKRFSIIDQENIGSGQSRNAGIKKARGAYLTFVDADDTVTVNFLQDFITATENGKNDICICNYLLVDIDGEVKNCVDDVNRSAKKPLMFRIIAGDMNNGPWAKFYRTSLLTKNNIYFPSKHIPFEDLAFTPIAFHFATEIGFVTGYNYLWLENPGSSSRGLDFKHWEAYKFLIDDACDGNMATYLTSDEQMMRKFYYLRHLIWKSSLYPVNVELCNQIKRDILATRNLQISITEIVMLDNGGYTLWKRLIAQRAGREFYEIKSLLLPPQFTFAHMGQLTFTALFVRILNLTMLRRRQVYLPPTVTFAFLIFLILKKIKSIFTKDRDEIP